MDVESDEGKIKKYIERSTYCIFELYRFLNLYLNKSSNKDKILIDASYLTSEEEYEKEKIK